MVRAIFVIVRITVISAIVSSTGMASSLRFLVVTPTFMLQNSASKNKENERVSSLLFVGPIRGVDYSGEAVISIISGNL